MCKDHNNCSLGSRNEFMTIIDLAKYAVIGALESTNNLMHVALEWEKFLEI
jgi:hypothetical protein